MDKINYNDKFPSEKFLLCFDIISFTIGTLVPTLLHKHAKYWKQKKKGFG